jgi:hypothetical protein
LGLDPLTKNAGTASGISGATPVYNWNLEMDFGPALKISAYVGFTSGMDAIGLGLLGQMGFFDKVNVQFDYRRRLFFVEIDDPPTHPPAAP